MRPGEFARLISKLPLKNITFEERGDPSPTPVILLHGFPEDVRTWDGVVETLTSSGFRTIAPYLRGLGQTRFLDPRSFRNDQIAALTQDVIEFADALGFDSFLLVGHDWGVRAVYAWPRYGQNGYKVLSLSRSATERAPLIRNSPSSKPKPIGTSGTFTLIGAGRH